MRRLIVIVLLALSLAACTPAENEGGTPIPGAQSGAPLNDEAAGPGEQSEIDD
jgi:hypothetical protein